MNDCLYYDWPWTGRIPTCEAGQLSCPAVATTCPGYTQKPKPKTDMNLIPAINNIRAQIKVIEARHVSELKPYVESLEALRKINTACENCGGTGKIFRRACAEDEGDYHRCEVCHGTGKIVEEKEINHDRHQRISG